jgi:GR25 family glycosyltransferase involved in LPS biosynthesis
MEISETVVYGLDRSEERWQRCLRILQKERIKDVTRFITTENKADLYRHANRDFVEMMRSRKGETTLFFEDDFELTSNWREVLDKAAADLPKDWDILYLGANLTAKPILVTENLLRVKGAWMLHGVIFRYKFVRYFLDNYRVTPWAIDQWFNEQALKCKFYMTYPMICYQRAGWSDFQNQNVDYRIFKNKFYERV